MAGNTNGTVDRFEDFLVEYPVCVITVAVGCLKMHINFCSLFCALNI